MNNDELLKALGKFSPQDIAEAIARTRREDASRKPFVTEEQIVNNASLALEKQIDKDRFDTEDSFTNASFDRQMMRVFLDEMAIKQQQDSGLGVTNSFADLHKWWDGTQYLITNDWLFADKMELEIELRNKNQESKFFRLKVSL